MCENRAHNTVSCYCYGQQHFQIKRRQLCTNTTRFELSYRLWPNPKRVDAVCPILRGIYIPLRSNHNTVVRPISASYYPMKLYRQFIGFCHQQNQIPAILQSRFFSRTTSIMVSCAGEVSFCVLVRSMASVIMNEFELIPFPSTGKRK